MRDELNVGAEDGFGVDRDRFQQCRERHVARFPYAGERLHCRLLGDAAGIQAPEYFRVIRRPVARIVLARDGDDGYGEEVFCALCPSGVFPVAGFFFVDGRPSTQAV